MVLTSAAVGAELVRGRSACGAVPADDVGATLTLAAVGVAHAAERTLRVTLAFWETEADTGMHVRNHAEEKHSAPTLSEGDSDRSMRQKVSACGRNVKKKPVGSCSGRGSI